MTRAADPSAEPRTIASHAGASLICITILALSACAHRMMPTPIVLREPGAHTIVTQPTTVEVLFATDRRPDTSDGGRVTYAAARGYSLRLGVASVRLGGTDEDAVELRRRIELNERPRIEVECIEEYGEHWLTIPLSDENAPLDEVDRDESDPIREPEQAFIRAVNERLSPAGRVLIYVPGFNTSFNMPIRLIADLSYHLEGRSLPIAFSWPARSVPMGYTRQMATAKISARNLRELILLISEKTNAQAIDILSYSAGAPIVTDALHQLRLMHSGDTIEQLRSSLRIGRVIYAGADEDLDRFRNMYLDGFTEVAKAVTIYTSRRDRGLLLAQMFANGSTRLGRASSTLPIRERQALADNSTISLVDVSFAQKRAGGGGDLWSHAYWFGNAWVSADVVTQLRYDLDPFARGLAWDADEATWAFPDEYPTRISQVLTDVLTVEVVDAP